MSQSFPSRKKDAVLFILTIMILRNRQSCLFAVSALLLHILLLTTPTLAKKDRPRIKIQKFDAPPAAPPFYFEDSDVILILDVDGTVLRSDNTGEEWKPIADVPKGEAYELIFHPYNKKIAYIWGKVGNHWVTDDRGKTWQSFEAKGRPVRQRPAFSFHANDPDKVVINVCTVPLICDEMSYYTKDGFREPVKELRKDTRGCVFARSTPLFETSKDDEGDNRIVCAVKGKYSRPFGNRDNELRVSDNYFEDEDEPILEEGRTVQGIINLAVVKGYLVAAASAKGTTELAMYVTDDAKTWHRAMFPNDHKLEEDAYTILESTNYSIQVDVLTTRPLNAMGVLFTSNSNGTYFTRNIEHTNRNMHGLVDFEKISGIQGIALVNIVDNFKEVEESALVEKKLKSKISFDDGRNFSPLTVDKDELHLHSVTDMSNIGRVFSSPAPGLVMGVGNKGEYLKPYEEGDVYVSDDAGFTWTRALKEAHKYEFGDKGAVLVAIYDEGPVDEIKYSLNHGHDWEKVELEKKVRAKILTTTPDSTSLKFLLLATEGGGEGMKHYSIVVDFAELHEDKCKEDDFEEWYARKDEKGEPTCVMGQKQWYRRRKWDADCFVDEEFKDPVPQFKKCACAEEDFECDFNFIPSKDGSKCNPASFMDAPEDQCKDGAKTFKARSGFRLIPDNKCDREAKGAVNLDVDVERDCKDSTRPPPASGEISNELTEFRADKFEEFFYLERSDVSVKEDETVVMRTNEHEVYITHDAGKSWKQILKDKEITAVYPHQYFNDVVFFLTPGKTVHYSVNRGDTFEHFEAPENPTRDRLQILGFHQKYKDFLIWTGGKDCGSSDKGTCHNVAFFTEDRGANWIHQARYVNKCEFIKEEGRGGIEKLVYCEMYEEEKPDGRLQLRWSDNWFANSKEAFPDIVDFATMSEFIVVAARNQDDKDALTCHTSINGKTFANAQFPPSLEVPREKAYTVLDSSTHAVFLHVTVSNRENSEYGSLIKSNSNGTSYVMSLDGVNRDKKGYVDFEKMLGLEGVILVNQVHNIDETEKGASKKLRSLITHNDGAQWAPLQAPQKDAEGHNYECDTSDTKECSLHLHSYTERADPRATFSSPSAIGLMMGVGNVGKNLVRKGDADTFITRDGGLRWHSVMKGRFMWEYGDQGSIIVIVKEDAATSLVYYTLDEGESWIEYPFSEKPFAVAAISTVPSDKSRNFILWGKYADSDSKIATINLDFTGLTDRQCILDEQKPTDDDYDLWEPKHPAQEGNCLLGHIKQYHRKKVDHECFNGPSIRHEHNIIKNCTCTREDFEW